VVKHEFPLVNNGPGQAKVENHYYYNGVSLRLLFCGTNAIIKPRLTFSAADLSKYLQREGVVRFR